jgi:2-dehydro-3-deoxyphosphooctonate aldolase (KDO 8-P synthase)
VVAVGVDGLFLEVHDEPDASPCDAPTQWPLARLPALLRELVEIARASRWREDGTHSRGAKRGA